MIVLCAIQADAQNKFTINGRLKIDGGSIDGSRVVVYRNGQKERVINSNLNKFSMELDMNANYILSFEKDGFVSKKISFNTNVPPEAAAIQFTPFDYAVSLFKQYDDLNMVVFDQPVGIIRYETGLGDFNYDTDYTRSIQSQLQQAMEDVERKQKEEALNATADAKRKAEEEKEQARLKAEAERAAAEQAKAQAEAARAAEAKAKALEAEEKAAALARAKAEEEARRAEKLRAEKEQAEAIAKEKAMKAEEARVVQKPKPVEKPVIAQKPAPVARPIKADPVAKVETPVRTHTDLKPAPRSKPHSDPKLAQVHSESVPRRTTKAIAEEETKPVEEKVATWTDRKEELIVEPNKVMTVVKITEGEVITEYRKVIHKWGSTFYFKNGAACTQLIYETEAFEESLAGATPRGKFGP